MRNVMQRVGLEDGTDKAQLAAISWYPEGHCGPSPDRPITDGADLVVTHWVPARAGWPDVPKP